MLMAYRNLTGEGCCSGRLVGVNTAIYSPSGASAGIGFAVPVDIVYPPQSTTLGAGFVILKATKFPEMANALVALSGAMLCQQQRYADLGSGSGMLVVGLASVIIGQALFGHRGVTVGILSAVVGSVLYRVILQAAYQVDMPSYMVKLLSALIVTVALVLPLVQEKSKEWRQRRTAQKERPE